MRSTDNNALHKAYFLFTEAADHGVERELEFLPA